MRVNAFRDFIVARDRVREEKEAGKPKPWTSDPILQTYRFCNVRREDDKVTRWVASNWRRQWVDHPQLWFALTIARLFNLPDALKAIEPYVLPIDSRKIKGTLNERKDEGLKNFNAAYIVSTNGRPMDKVDYLLKEVLGPLWRKRAAITASLRGAALAEVHSVLQAQQGLGSFMAAQIVADLKYADPFLEAPDWHTFAASGPGSRRGLNRVLGRAPDTTFGNERVWRALLAELRNATLPKLPPPLRDLHAQDIQNCLCEFDKYERIRTGEGRPKQLYQGRA